MNKVLRALNSNILITHVKFLKEVCPQRTAKFPSAPAARGGGGGGVDTKRNVPFRVFRLNRSTAGSDRIYGYMAGDVFKINFMNRNYS